MLSNFMRDMFNYFGSSRYIERTEYNLWSELAIAIRNLAKP